MVDPIGAWICLYVRNETGVLKQNGLRERSGDRSPLASALLEGFSVDYQKLFAEPS